MVKPLTRHVYVREAAHGWEEAVELTMLSYPRGTLFEIVGLSKVPGHVVAKLIRADRFIRIKEESFR